MFYGINASLSRSRKVVSGCPAKPRSAPGPGRRIIDRDVNRLPALHEATEADPPVALDLRALAFTVALAFSQDAVYALVFLSYMNHYLLDVLGASPGLPGYTLALYGGTKLVVHPLAGRLLDRTRPRLVYGASVAVQVTGLAALLAFHTLAAFLAGAFLLAIGSAAMWPLVYDALARTQPSEGQPRAVGVLALAGYLAVGVGFGAGVLLAARGPWRTAFVLAAAIVALPALFQRSRALDPGGRHGGDESGSPAAARHRLAVFGLVILLDYAAVSSLAGIYGPYIRLSLGITLLRAAVGLAPAGLAALAALAAASRFSRPGRRPHELALFFACSATGAALLGAASSGWTAALAAIPLAAGVGGTGPLLAATMIDLGGSKGRGLVLGTLMSVEGVGSVAGPAVVATVAELASPRAALAAIGIVYALLTIVVSAAASRLAPRGAAAARGTARSQSG